MVLNILIIKSPEEWAITKQACRDESVVFFLFPIYIYVFSYRLGDVLNPVLGIGSKEAIILTLNEEI